MEKNCGSRFPQPHFDWQSHNLSYLGSALPLGHGSNIAPLTNPDTNMVSKNGSFPMNPFFGLPGPQDGHVTDSCGWFYCMPRFRQALTPISPIFNQKVLDALKETVKRDAAPKLESRCAQKKFLVFDQSGDQTTLIFSSGMEAPAKCLTSCTPKPMGAYNLNTEDPGITEHPIQPFNKCIMPDEFSEKNETDLKSEMHEDTDELNALLYSDDDSDYEELDDVTSTGHSPGTMTTHEKQDRFEQLMEEVASSDGSSRKRKLFQGSCGTVPSLIHTASSKMTVRSAGAAWCEDNAESKRTDFTSLPFGKMGSADWGNKRMRKDRIRETVRVLQNIIPRGKSKNPICVFDEAIEYLECLKNNTEALCLDAL